MIESVVTALATAFVMLGGFGLYERDQRQKREVEALKAENQKLKDANRKNLPYNTAEELEHLLATIVVLEQDLDIKTTLLQNIKAHALLARENKRAGAHG